MTACDFIFDASQSQNNQEMLMTRKKHLNFEINATLKINFWALYWAVTVKCWIEKEESWHILVISLINMYIFSYYVWTLKKQQQSTQRCSDDIVCFEMAIFSLYLKHHILVENIYVKEVKYVLGDFFPCIDIQISYSVLRGKCQNRPV